MSEIKVRGYVNKFQVRQSKAGNAYYTFSLAERIKDKTAPDGKRKVYFNCTMFQDPPKEGDFVEASGYFSPRDYEKDGQKRTSLDVSVKSVVVNPSREAGAPKADDKDPWDISAGAQ